MVKNDKKKQEQQLMDIHCSTYLTDLYRYSLVYLD